MLARYGLLAVCFAGVTLVSAQTPAPAPAPQTAPAQTPAPEPAGRGQGRGQGRGLATFPAQQRPPGDPALIEKGKAIYTNTCVPCHGADLRGGVTGGPNLLRSAVVLNDKAGELVLPIIRGARAERGMPALPMSDDDVGAVAEYLHSVVATLRNQGAPPATNIPPPDIVVGNAAAGQAYFAARCASCHSATGDLQGIATRVGDAKALQNLWVSGGLVGGRGGRGGGGGRGRVVTATVSLPDGSKVQGRLVQIDHFTLSLALEDGTIRSFRRDGERPKVDLVDSWDGHRTLLGLLTDKDMHDVTAYLVTLK